ncbi:hypothetical protein IKF88_02410 [Candidatus Saccharibacteria bacterium]|nr:hypothetical protein [Candidatus Saccharibacteria bacterium]
MEIAFFVVCLTAGFALAFAIAFAIGKVAKQNKWPDWVSGTVGVVLAIAGLFAGAWFADAYKQYIIDQEHDRQLETCRYNADSAKQCDYFWDMLNN